MKVSGSWRQAEGTQALLAALQSAGQVALFVGGCVRNAILGQGVDDIDIATDAIPDRVAEIAAKSGFRVVPTGLDHGTLTVIAGGKAHEVTTLRRDTRTDGRHAIVSYTGDIAEDAARRDFTMNALYAQADGTVIDPLGGLPDLLAGRVRFVGDPVRRIEEDHLRILRFFRFVAIYGDPGLGIDADGLAACAANSAYIETLSRERIGAEMRKLLMAQDPAPALAAMEAAGVLAQVLPGATARMMPVLMHLEDGTRRSWLCRLAVLGGGDATTKLRLSRTETATLDQLLAGIGSLTAPDGLGWLYGPDLAADILHARGALLAARLPSDWQLHVARGAAATFPVSAADLMPGLQGAALGAKLQELQRRWLESGLTLTRQQLLT